MMDEAIAKAKTLQEALGYIRKFHDQLVVVKVGGSIMDEPENLKRLLTDVVFMNYVGMRPVIVHGGGKAINAAMAEKGLSPRTVAGLRYTDEATLAIAEEVLCNRINRDLVETIQAQGVEAMGLHSLSSVVLFAERIMARDEEGVEQDVGYVGRVTGVNARLLNLLAAADAIPVIATIARDRSGHKLNVNADTAAGAVAAALKAEKLVVVSDTHGIRMDPQDPATNVSSLTIAQTEELEKKGIISRGMLPKVEACITAIKGGAKKAHIIDGRIPHALLLEIYTDKGIGTEIVH
ncbi:MAG: acetylglutamate kinase [Phycisphaerae bacterium]